MMGVFIGELSLTSSAVQKCPFPAYAAMLDQGPIYYDKAADLFVVVGYDEIKQVAADFETFANATGRLLVTDVPHQAKIDAIYQEHGYVPVNTLAVADPPVHSRQRALVDKVFTSATLKPIEPQIEGAVEHVIDGFAEQGKVEFYRDVASQIASIVILEQLGLPKEETQTFKRWADAVIADIDQTATEEERLASTRVICELHRYLGEKAAEYRAHPQPCLLSKIANADVNGNQLELRELVSMVQQLVAAGHDSSASAMTSAMYRMIKQPGLEAELRADPRLIPKFVEEILRLDSPVQGLYRAATRDAVVGGVAIPEGSILMLRWGAGNHDPRQFPDPDTMNVHRSNAARHLGFGSGLHHCVGHLLARAVIRIALTKLVTRLKNFRLVNEAGGIERQAHFFVYGFSKLEIAFDH